MIERRDEELSHIYRGAEGPRPPQRVDDNILAASQRVAGTVRRRADSPAKSPSVALPHPAPAAPSLPAASRSDRVKQPTLETALSGERRATGQPARVPAIPPGVEILRKSEELKPASAAAD